MTRFNLGGNVYDEQYNNGIKEGYGISISGTSEGMGKQW